MKHRETRKVLSLVGAAFALVVAVLLSLAGDLGAAVSPNLPSARFGDECEGGGGMELAGKGGKLFTPASLSIQPGDGDEVSCEIEGGDEDAPDICTACPASIQRRGMTCPFTRCSVWGSWGGITITLCWYKCGSVDSSSGNATAGLASQAYSLPLSATGP